MTVTEVRRGPTPPPGAAPADDIATLLSGLSEHQRLAVTSEATPLCILAAAGAGKTRVLTRRIAYRCATGRADAAHTLALTFTRKAAGEMQHRLSRLGLRQSVAAGTFHSTAAAALQRWWADRGQSAPVLLERKARILAGIVDGRSAVAGVPLSEIASLIEWAKARAVSPADAERALAEAGRPLPPGLSPAALAAVYGRYEDEKRRRHVIDFDDLLSRCADAMESDRRFADAQRWRWRHVYVDEFQDLNPLQYRLLNAWLGDSTDLCVVGDPNQAIYGWNGADPDLLRDLPARWHSTEIVHLDANHRCTGQIVRAAASVLGPSGGHLRSAGRDGPDPTVTSYGSGRAEARRISEAVATAHSAGRPWSDMAVLTRTNAQLNEIGEALTAIGVPWWSAASAALLDEPAVRSSLQGLRSRFYAPLQAAAADLAAEAPSDPSTAVMAELARSFLTVHPDATVGEWLAWLPSTAKDRSDAPVSRDAVTLCSFHRAKGLEWSAVWVAGVEEGLVPLGRSGQGPAAEEERRLLYVALTRAVDELHISWAETRWFGGRPVARRPSRWLDAIESAVGTTSPGPGTPAPSWRDRLAEQKAALRAAAFPGRPAARPPQWPDPDEAIRAALRAWRVEMARASGVVPGVLLHDATIDALASLRPSTPEELLAVPGFGPVKAARYGPDLLRLLGGLAVAV